MPATQKAFFFSWASTKYGFNVISSRKGRFDFRPNKSNRLNSHAITRTPPEFF